MAELHHLGRMPQAISLNDRDVIFFLHDRIKTKISTKMEIKRSATDTDILFTLDTPELPLADDRILMWGRNVTSGIDDTSLINGMRVASYIDSDIPYEEINQALKPLREIISYKLSYDRVSNILTMIFWTNFSQQLTIYDPTKIVKIDEDAVTIASSFPSSFVTARPHLCVTTAKIEQLNITGGVINETLTAPDKSNDFVPIFTKPRIMYSREYPQPDTGVTGNVPILDFFTIKDSDVCDCVESPLSDTYDQLSDYCDVINLNKNLGSSSTAAVQMKNDSSSIGKFRLDFYSDVGLTTLIESSDIFTFSASSQSVSISGGLTGLIGAVKTGTITNIKLELVETGDASNQLSGYGGITKIAEATESSGPLDVHVVDDTGGFFHIEIFDPAGPTKLMHTATYNSIGDKAIIDDVAFGFGGTITVDAVGPATTGITLSFVKTGDSLNQITGFAIDDLFTKTRETVYFEQITTDTWHVEFTGGTGKKIGQTATFTTPGAKTVTSFGASFCPPISGTITVDRIVTPDSVGIQCLNGCSCAEQDPASVYYIEVSDVLNPGHKFYVKTDPGDGSAGGNSGNWISGLFFPYWNFGAGFSTTGIMAEMTGAAGGGYKLEILVGTGGAVPAGGAWNIETPSTPPIGFLAPVAWGATIADGPRTWKITAWLHQNFDPTDTLLP